MSLYLGTNPIANTGYDKANTDLSNLSSIGKNIANWSNNVSNCITEIPQDIKLELNNGTLTLKAGSKVYVPNGDGVFTSVTINSDLTITSTTATRIEGVLFYRATSNSLYFDTTDGISSGSSASPTKTTWMWYDTTNNKIKRSENTGSTWFDGFSFPLCIFTRDGGKISSIDQVFNGFGYIGSTVFALPGVKGLIPNGRNADGSLKNTEFTISNVSTNTYTTNGDYYFRVGNNYVGFYLTSTYYDEKENFIIYNEKHQSQIIAGNVKISDGKIASLTPKTAFHAVDYNDAVLTSNLATCHVVVKSYVNGASWYRVWSDGWVEQGGYSLYDSANPTNPRTVNLLKTMANTNYTITNSTDNAWSSNPLTYSRIACVYSKATTNFRMTGIFSNGAGTDYSFYWQVSGQGA